jgi:hypothetical protein
VEAAARVQTQSTGPTYDRRQPEKTALYQVLQKHLLTFEQQWTDEANGRTLPKFVLDELHRFLLGQVLRIFTDTVACWYRRRQGTSGLASGETGAVTAIQRANSDLRLIRISTR